MMSHTYRCMHTSKLYGVLRVNTDTEREDCYFRVSVHELLVQTQLDAQQSVDASAMQVCYCARERVLLSASVSVLPVRATKSYP